MLTSLKHLTNKEKKPPMATQSIDSTDFAPQDEGEPLPEGYEEALEIHKELAISLITKAIHGQNDCCSNCSFWVGRCLKEKVNCISYDVAYEEFSKAREVTE
jgi:hypothetical protein